MRAEVWPTDLISRQISGNVGRSHFNNTMVTETCVVKRELKEKRHQQSYCVCFKGKENPQLLAEIIRREECDFSIGKRKAYCTQMGNPIEKTQWFPVESSWIQNPAHSQDLGWWWCTGDPLLAISGSHTYSEDHKELSLPTAWVAD